MNNFSTLTITVLIFFSGTIAAAPAFEVSGVHIDMLFNDAVAQAEKLGGVCQFSTSRTNDAAVYAQCEYQSCDTQNPVAGCDRQDTESPGISIAGQPIIRIGFEAPDAASRLTQVVVTFEGTSNAVEAHFTKQFGKPGRDGSASSEKSWTTARRLHWKEGNHHLGLHTTVNIIMLTTNRRVTDSDPGTN